MKLLGLRFEPVRSAPVASGETMRFCYSLPGPPHIELVEIQSAIVAATFERLRDAAGVR